jgi:O-antigen ligase
MTTLLWVALLWLPVFLLDRRLVTDPLERRLHLALILVLFATHWSGSVVEADVILQDPIAMERVVRGILTGVAVIVATSVLARQQPALFSRRLPSVTLLGLYVLINGISTIYSVAPIVTAAKAFELLTGFVIILGIATLEVPVPALKRSIVLLITLEGVLMAVSVIGFFALPGIFSTLEARQGFITERTLTGIFMSPNALSVTGAVVAVFALARLLKSPRAPHRALLWSGLAIGLTAIALASGRQGLIILIVSVAIVQLALRPFQAVFWVLPAVIVSGVLYANELATAFTRGQQIQLLISLSGRTEWWGAAMSAWLEHPWLGYGFGAGGRFVALERIGFGNVSSLHSGYLEVLTGVGILGFVPLVLVLVGVGRFCLRVIRVETEYAILLIPLVLHAFISLGFGGWLNTDFLLLGFLAGLADTWSPDEEARPYADVAVPGRSRLTPRRRFSTT